MNRRASGRFAAAIWLALLLSACASLIGPFSPIAYQNATSLKAETLALMDKASEPYAQHSAEVDKLMVNVDKAYEYVAGVPLNETSAEQWLILKKPDGNLLGKFFSRWKRDGSLSKSYITEFRGVISDAYDEIICLEANKKAATSCGGTVTGVQQ